MKGRLLIRLPAGPGVPDERCTIEGRRRYLESGAVIEDPQVCELVHRGFAEPADEECRLAAVALAERSPETVGFGRREHDRIMRERLEWQFEQQDQAEEQWQD